jgi:hypothetical protein
VLRILKYVGLVGGLLVLMAVLYLSLHGLPAAWTREIERQLQFSGMVLSLDKVRLGVFEGIIASQVRYYRRGDIGEPVFEAEKIILHFDPRRWLAGTNGVTGGQVKNGRFRLLLSPGSSNACPQILTFTNLQAQLRWDQAAGLRVEEFATALADIRLTGRGVLNLPPAGAGLPLTEPLAAAGWDSGRLSSLAQDLLRLGQAAHLGKTLHAELVFLADLQDIRKLELQLKLDSQDTRLGRSRLGAWQARIGVRDLKAEGILEITNAIVQGVALEQAVCRFACDDRLLTIAQLTAVAGHGAGKGPLSLAGQYWWRSSEFEGRASAGLDLRAFLPWLHQVCPAQAWILEDFQFNGSPPQIQAAFHGRWQPEFSLEVKSRTKVSELAYRGVPLAEAQVGVTVAWTGTNRALVSIAPLAVERPEGSGQGWIVVNPKAHTVSFDAVSTLPPYALAQMIDPFIEQLVRHFRFAGPLQAVGWGTVGLSAHAADEMDLMIEARDAGWGKFLAEHCALDLRRVGEQTEITDMRGAIYGGRFDARASIFPVQNGPGLHYETEASVAQVDFGRLLEVLAGKSAAPYAGRLSAHLELAGAIGAGQGSSARGRGWVAIRDGHVFQIPLFGGLSDFLARLIPGMGALLRQTDVQAEFVVEDGKIRSDEILIEGDVFSLVGRGAYALDGALDFNVQVKLLRQDNWAADVFRFMTQPFSKLLEFHLGGTLAAPRWRPVNIPTGVFLIFD